MQYMATRKIVGLTVLCLLFSGCGDPATDQLEVGTTVVVSEMDGTRMDQSSGGFGPKLPPGVKMTIGYDSGVFVAEDGVEYKAGHRMSCFRKVKVIVETGEHRGMSGAVYRRDIRPTR